MYLYLTWVFPFDATLYSTTFKRKILYFLLHYIYLTALVTFQMKIWHSGYSGLYSYQQWSDERDQNRTNKIKQFFSKFNEGVNCLPFKSLLSSTIANCTSLSYIGKLNRVCSSCRNSPTNPMTKLADLLHREITGYVGSESCQSWCMCDP